MGKNLFFAGLALCAANVFGAVYYVATDGNDNNAGSQAKPFATLNKANAVVKAGDTVWVRGGTYYPTDTTYLKSDVMSAGIVLSTSGTSDDNRVHYLAYPGEQPVFDFSRLKIGVAYSTNNGSDSIMYTNGLVIRGSYIHLKGLEICNMPMKHNSNVGVYITRSKHIFLEQINSHHNKGAGFFVNEKNTGSGGGHYFLNCDSHDNYDPNGRQGDGENADGFGVHYQKPGQGDTTKFHGCRAWWNSDDGWDFIFQGFPVVVENSYAMGNGYASYGTVHPKNANGNGFKAGSDTSGTAHHVIRQCVAWKNYSSGFYANHSTAGNKWYNNTSYNNLGTQYNMLASTYNGTTVATNGEILTGANAHDMKNNIAFPNKTAYIGSYGGKNYAAGSNNTWNLSITPKESDFVSVSDPSMTTTGKDISALAGALGPRKADGSLPDVDFLKLKGGSQMIDKGTNVGIPYVGGAPDLGAYEYGATVPVSSSSVMPASSSSTPASSSAAAATLTKHGEGSSSQCVDLGAAVVNFYYTIANATGATVTGLPEGVTGRLSGMDFTISGTVSATNAVGSYAYTVTTTGGSPNATKSGTITVSENCNGATSSSSAVSSSSVAAVSSSTVESSSSVPVTSSSSEETTRLASLLQHGSFVTGTVQVLDMQGRYLGNMQATGRDLAESLWAQFKRPGVYLVRQGKSLLRVRVK